jgi:hypothetical protein
LRSENFLTGYPQLYLPGNVRLTGAFADALKALVAHSPLTQLVYLDVLQPRDDAALEPDDKRRAFLALVYRTTTPVAHGDWVDLWLSLLARSLVGAVLSPAPVFEQWQQADDVRRQLEAQAASRAGRLGLTGPPPVSLAIARARAWCEQLRNRGRKQYVDRLVVLGDALSASRYLSLRFMDMLVRQVAADSAPAMEQEWQRHRRRIPQPHPANVLLSAGDSGVCCRLFQTVLIGEPPVDRTRFGDAENRRLGSALMRLAGLAGEPVDRTMLSEQSGAHAAEELLRQFVEVGVAMPFRVPHSRGGSPARVLPDWFEATYNALAISSDEADGSEAGVEADAEA